jgi:hypothetical protein
VVGCLGLLGSSICSLVIPPVLSHVARYPSPTPRRDPGGLPQYVRKSKTSYDNRILRNSIGGEAGAWEAVRRELYTYDICIRLAADILLFGLTLFREYTHTSSHLVCLGS